MNLKINSRKGQLRKLALTLLMITLVIGIAIASDLSGFTNINATNFYQSGQLVLDAASSWSGDLTGTGLNPEVTDDSHSHSQLTITADTIDGTELNDTITLDANLLIQGYNVSINGTTFNVDSTNERIGIGTSTPTQKLDVAGNINLSASNGIIYFDSGARIETNSTCLILYSPSGANKIEVCD